MTIAWVFFRARTLQDAVYIIEHFFTGWSQSPGLLALKAIGSYVSFNSTDIIFCLSYICLLLLTEFVQRRFNHLMIPSTSYWRWPVYYIMIAGILFLGVWGQQQFIYFQF